MLGEKGGDVTIVATSDLHGYLDDIEMVCSQNKADILVIAGDIEPANIWVRKEEWFLNDFASILERLGNKGVEVVAIEGNHDFWLSGNAHRMTAPNFHLLRDSGITIKGLTFYGTPWVPYINGQWCYEAEDEDNIDRYMRMPMHTDILITHSPPLIPDAHIDESTQYDKRYWKHFGSQSLYDAIMRKMPHINFCGHIHSGDHKQHIIKTKFSDCYCYNVSRINERYLIAYPMRVLRIKDGELIDVSPKSRKTTRKKGVA